MYALVRNGAVVKTGNLPQSFTRLDGTSVSGYDQMTAEEHLVDGWMPLIENRPPLTQNMVHGDPAVTIGTTDVTYDYPLVPEPQTSINQRAIVQLLSDFLGNWETPIASLQAIRDSPQATFSNVAQAQTAVRAAQDAIKECARIEQELIKRVAGILQVLLEEYDTVEGA
jgi:hypothetical protein